MHDMKKKACMKQVKQVVNIMTWNKTSIQGKRRENEWKKETLLGNRKKKLVKPPRGKTPPKKNVH